MLPNNPAPRRRLPTGIWWLVVAAVGAATIWSMTSAVHDSGQRREAAVLAARAVVDHIATLVAGRLEVMAATTLAPALPWSSVAAPAPAEAVRALVEAQAEGIRCQCRPLAPASHFFAGSIDSGLAIAAVPRVDSAADGLSSAALTRVVQEELTASPAGDRSVARLLANRSLPGQLILLVIRRDADGRGVAAYGLVAGARAMAMASFPHERLPADVPPSSARVIMLDTLSLEVTTADSLRIFGALAPDRPFRASVQPGGALAGLTLTVALSASQVPYRVFLEPGRLWIVALLLGSTIVLIVVAAGASRRETLLARARTDFIAGVSHDLRMPLAQVLLAGETLALDRVESDQQRRTLAESIVREARRLTSLVDNVLLFSRSGAVALGPARQAVAVDGLLAAVADSVGLSVTDAGQALAVTPAPGLMVRGDHALLRQALVNLVDNALKYGPRGQVIRLEAVPAGDGAVELRVEDAGPGIPAAERDRVLEPYRRMTVDHHSERTGSGLGLAVVRQIALACGGSVHLDEAPRGGTRAVLRLQPVARARR
jgi:signal transduction histidine kinase